MKEGSDISWDGCEVEKGSKKEKRELTESRKYMYPDPKTTTTNIIIPIIHPTYELFEVDLVEFGSSGFFAM